MNWTDDSFLDGPFPNALTDKAELSDTSNRIRHCDVDPCSFHRSFSQFFSSTATKLYVHLQSKHPLDISFDYSRTVALKRTPRLDEPMDSMLNVIDGVGYYSSDTAWIIDTILKS